jgi:pimeloyl-ACP methyl ester carboxylesterase
MTTLLLYPITPILVGLAVLALGLAGALRCTSWIVRGLAGLVALIGLAMTFGAGFNAWKMDADTRRWPAPGQFVTVAGARVHVRCEGSRDAETVLLIPGGYAQGLFMHPLQTALSDRWRACVVDRSGTGWSPITAARPTVDYVIDQLHGALSAAGERPAVAIVGHSMGGLYAVNYAAAWPGEVRAVVLLDPTEPGDTLVNWAGTGPGAVVAAWTPILGAAFGLANIRALNPLYGPGTAPIRAAFGADYDRLVAFEVRPSAVINTMRAIQAPYDDPLSIIRTPGVLSRQAVLLVPQTPPTTPEAPPTGVTGRRARNLRALMDVARTESMMFSPRHELIYAPAGATHQFLFTQPAFTVRIVRDFLTRHLASGAI